MPENAMGYKLTMPHATGLFVGGGAQFHRIMSHALVMQENE
jgi:hypothetical protein